MQAFQSREPQCLLLRVPLVDLLFGHPALEGRVAGFDPRRTWRLHPSFRPEEVADVADDLLEVALVALDILPSDVGERGLQVEALLFEDQEFLLVERLGAAPAKTERPNAPSGTG